MTKCASCELDPCVCDYARRLCQAIGESVVAEMDLWGLAHIPTPGWHQFDVQQRLTRLVRTNIREWEDSYR